jgi:hypothetical protein
VRTGLGAGSEDCVRSGVVWSEGWNKYQKLKVSGL